MYSMSRSSYFDRKANFIHVSTVPLNFITNVLVVSPLKFLRMLNSIMVSPNYESFNVRTFNPHLNVLAENYDVPNTLTDVDLVFEDKLKDLRGYTLKIIKHYDLSIEILSNLKLVQEIAQVLNAKARIEIELGVDYFDDFIERFARKLTNNEVDLTVNRLKIFTEDRMIPPVYTHDQYSYCALVPLPHRISFFELLKRPFDGWTWLLILVIVFIAAVVWKCLTKGIENESSTLRFIFAVYASFTSQTVEVRSSRRLHVTLLQLLIFGTFILGNAYQSILISFLSISRNGTRLNTFQELIESNYNFTMEPLLFGMINSSGDLPDLMARSTEMSNGIKSETSSDMIFHDYERYARENTVVVMTCENAEGDMKFLPLQQEQQNPVKFFYQLPEKFFNNPTMILLSKESPYQDVFQRIANRIFESGIVRHWRHVSYVSGGIQVELDEMHLLNEEYMLKMSDLYSVFIALALLHLISTSVFLMELFLGDLFAKFSFGDFPRGTNFLKRKMPLKGKNAKSFVVVESLEV